MNCRHHNANPCDRCAGSDEYAPTVYSDIVERGPLYWHKQALYWMNKFLDAEREKKPLYTELRDLRQSQVQDPKQTKGDVS